MTTFRFLLTSLSLATGFVVVGPLTSTAADAASSDLPPLSSIVPNGHCYELRTYHVHPGKLEALHARFRNHTIKLLEKHGMKLIGFWVPQDADKGAENTLVYVVEHPTREAAKVAWAEFGKDPDWVAARTESERAGPIVIKVDSLFMSPTDYSRLK